MRGALRWILRILAVLILAIATVALWKREEITRLFAVNSLFAPEKIVANFSAMDKAFLTVTMDKGAGPISPLPNGPKMGPIDGLDDFITNRSLTALVVLKDGTIRHEGYYQGTTAEDRRISWSVAKSYLSALMGIVVHDGQIASLNDPVTKYAPSLIGSAYEKARIIDVMHMASGVTFNEDYLDFNSDINKMGRVLALGGSMDDFAAGLDETFVEPGVQWQYVSIDTHVLGMVIRGATGRTIPDLMAEKLIAPMGLEASPAYVTDGYGVAFVLGGLNVRTRDYARFGQMFLQNGFWNGTQIVPKDWVEQSTTMSAPTAPDEEQYGLQWWAPNDAKPGEYLARGIYGQYIYIDRANDVVIVMNSADRKFRNDGVFDENIAMFRKIAAAL